MSDTEACGSTEKPQFLPNCADVSQFVQQALKKVLQATKCSNEMPAEGDDFDYYSSFQGFQDVMNIEGKRILHMVQNILKHQNVKVSLGSASGAADIEDKFDLLMDANDQILERVGTWLDEASGIKKDDSSLVIATATPKQQTYASWNKKSPGTSSTPSFKLLSARNIQRPQMKFKDKVDNRPLPFIPVIRNKPNALKSLEESLRLSEGVTAEMAEKPDFKYPHPYRFELDNLTYSDDQLKPATINGTQTLEETPFTWISKAEQLEGLLAELKKTTEIAVDLEHHSYRTFQGILCLMQISTRSKDYLIDTLELRSDLQCLNEVFTDPKIVKVLHGADLDIEWLQRDLGVYIVNMFDTGQAARTMNLGRFSLAHLLQHYCNVTADKQYQLADWRIRPLPEELKKYAREDTHYLLYIYDKMKNEILERGNESKNLLHSVLKKSAQICLKVYQKPQCRPDGYKDLYVKNKKVFNSQQMLAFSELFAWRDETARMEDESYGYVLPNHMMLQICDILPREKQGILACCNPIPPLVRQYLSDIHVIIKKAREAPLHKVELVKDDKRRPTQYQHPKYNVDSLLHCPHDLSHQDQVMDTDAQTCLLDSSLVATKSSLFSNAPNSIIVVKSEPLLTVLNSKPRTTTLLSAVQKKVAEIKASCLSPYLQYLPEDSKKVSSVLTPAKKLGGGTVNVQTSPSWKLLPASVKRKPSEDGTGNSPSVSAPPSKRSRTDLQGNAGEINQHLRFTDEDVEVIEKTEDDKKALPQDLEIPLRFQIPSKKKKKEKVEDIDIIDSVQKHLTHLRRLERSNDLALGENPGDEQPLDLAEKIRERVEQRKLNKKQKKNKKKQQSEVATAADKSSNVEETDKNTEKLRTEDTVLISDEETDTSKERSKEFKPYDYAEGAKKILQGSTSKDSEYYNPQLQMMKGRNKGSKRKAHIKIGQKSYTWKSKK